MRVRRKDLERALEGVPPYPRPKLAYEQYVTPSWLAADILWVAETRYGDICGMRVADLGAGTGRLALGAALLGAERVLAVDVDFEALNAAKSHLTREFPHLEAVDLLCADIASLGLRRGLRLDTVVQNPPFGVHRRGRDVLFLRRAVELAGVVYSVHKSSTRDYLVSLLEGELGCRVTILMTVDLPLSPTYEFHERRLHLVRIDVLRIEAS